MAQRTSVWRNSFKTFRQFGETVIMVLIANIRSDVIQILVRLYFISYATVTAKFRITKITTRSLARRHIRQGLSFALYDGSHAIGLYRDVWIAAIASSRTSLATLMGVMCNTSQCELRSLRVNLGMLNVIRIVTYYTLPPLESPDSFWIAMAFSR